jgi:ATP-dependent Clp protease ATP-binding subunit ClpA
VDSFNPTTKTQAALTAALQAATTAGNPQIMPAHLLMALLTQNDGIAAPLLEAVGVEPASVRTETQRLLDRLPSASGSNSQPQLSRESSSVNMSCFNWKLWLGWGFECVTVGFWLFGIWPVSSLVKEKHFHCAACDRI